MRLSIIDGLKCRFLPSSPPWLAKEVALLLLTTKGRKGISFFGRLFRRLALVVAAGVSAYANRRLPLDDFTIEVCTILLDVSVLTGSI